jgi:hypothetical protein
MSIVGVVSLLLASVAAFGWDAMKTVNAMIVIATSYGQDSYIAISFSRTGGQYPYCHCSIRVCGKHVRALY